jgi:hypothetical protein
MLAFNPSSHDMGSFLGKTAFMQPIHRDMSDIYRRSLRASATSPNTYEMRGTFNGSSIVLLSFNKEEKDFIRSFQDVFGEPIGNYIALRLMGKHLELINKWKEQWYANRG